jgi:transposase-like protein
VRHKWKKERVVPGSAAEKELLAVKKRWREVEMENEILKKAALITGGGS